VARWHEDLASDDPRRIPFRIEIIQSMPAAARSSGRSIVRLHAAMK
jgi:hypothetical protein